ncbi:MAG: mechanosensitive ion channel family protein [Planctomycetia bacterium]|nr:mechanosensitive ion channel family protein [Planctomycetia bacterium]
MMHAPLPAAAAPIGRRPISRLHARSAAAGLVVLILAVGSAAAPGAEEGPLAPLDTSSPRATLGAFIATVDRLAANFKELGQPTHQRQGIRAENGRLIRQGLSCLDLTGLPPSLADTQGREAAVHLKEVLDRIPLPPPEAIPDAAQVKGAGLDRWRLPGTEIHLVRVASGNRAGDFVFSTDTVARAEEFFKRVRHLPYRADAGSPGLFDSYVQLGGWLIPEQLISRLPAWAHATIGGETVWQWLATLLVALVAAGMVAGAARVRARCAGDALAAMERLVFPATLVAVGTGLDYLCTGQIRLTGDTLVAVKVVTRAVMLVGVVMGVLDAVGWATEWFLAWRGLGNDTIEGQLVRLASNVGRFLLVAWILIAAADSFGVPVTPLVAGLGAGGLAIALASQYTVENLIAGLVIFADKPVKIGDECQYGSVRGRVERIGLRSTRIRGTDRTVISIPNAEFAKSQLVNYSGRDRIPLSITLALPTAPGPAAVRQRLEALRELVAAHPGLDPEASAVTLGDPSGDTVTVEIATVCLGGSEREARVSRERLLLAALEVVGGDDAGLRLRAA